MVKMTKVLFESPEDALTKLKELDLLSKTKDVSHLLNIVYKELDSNDNMVSFPCEILGYNYKDNPKGTLNARYENLSVRANGKEFDINIEYLKDMQKSGFTTKSSDNVGSALPKAVESLSPKDSSLDTTKVNQTKEVEKIEKIKVKESESTQMSLFDSIDFGCTTSADSSIDIKEVNDVDTIDSTDVITSHSNKKASSDDVPIVIQLSTGIRKGIILEITNAKLTTKEAFLNTAIAKGFNKAMNTNLSPNEVMSNHFVNRYTSVNFDDDNETFNLEDDMTVFSVGHKKSDYIFVTENISIAEVDSKNYTRIVAIDFETANSRRASVCCVGYVVEEMGNIIHEEAVLINPMSKFSSNTISIHGITAEDVKDAPTWDIVWRDVCKYIDDSTLVIAHNLRSMELACIRQECERYNMELPAFARLKGHNKMAYDTLKLARENLPNLDNHRLDTLAEHFGIELNHHEALSDAKACLELFHHLRGDVVNA